jgi:hypothetical protein
MSTKQKWLRLTEQEIAEIEALGQKENRKLANMLAQLVRQALAAKQATS